MCADQSTPQNRLMFRKKGATEIWREAHWFSELWDNRRQTALPQILPHPSWFEETGCWRTSSLLRTVVMISITLTVTITSTTPSTLSLAVLCGQHLWYSPWHPYEFSSHPTPQGKEMRCCNAGTFQESTHSTQQSWASQIPKKALLMFTWFHMVMKNDHALLRGGCLFPVVECVEYRSYVYCCSATTETHRKKMLWSYQEDTTPMKGP